MAGSLCVVPIMLRKMLNGEAEAPSETQLWRFIWESKAQSKVLLFAWKVVRNALPTLVQLHRRGIQVEETCNSCLGLRKMSNMYSTCAPFHDKFGRYLVCLGESLSAKTVALKTGSGRSTGNFRAPILITS
ncbi:UNVERIFIED_CONTAM: hypothetical protein Slati_0232700 [Sesamum latifolium]|uniref:Reverse transcriptase zinc-binding domain-containing protein n=1 Tax=Sesamum latifolium TaxID=2727402 RepID=A0AAW2YC52_9LAMI